MSVELFSKSSIESFSAADIWLNSVQNMFQYPDGAKFQAKRKADHEVHKLWITLKIS